MSPDEASEERSSSTAGFVTFFRACSNKERDDRFRGPDYLAQMFHSGGEKYLLRLSFLLLPLMKRMVPGTYEWVVARTFFFDEVFEQALDEKLAQIVIMGAGFDTRAYRFQDKSDDTVIFELDLPEPQGIKIKRLNSERIAIPENVIYVPIDFTKDNIFTRLEEAGYSRSERSLFLWEGVTEYLTDEAVDSTMKSIRDNSPPGSLLAFSYIYRSVVEGTREYHGTKQIVKTVAKTGEPYRYGIPEGEIETFLSERGYRLVRHHTAEELERKYLMDEEGGLYGRICGHNCVALSQVAP